MRVSVKVGAIVLVSVLVVSAGGGAQVDVRATSGARKSAVGATVSLSPRQTFLAVTEICTLYVVAENGSDSLGCIECWVSFDTTLVALIDAEEGSVFQDAPFPRLFFSQPIAPDTQSVEGCLLGSQSFALTPGEIARFIFQALQGGVSPVRITRMNFWDIKREIFEPVVDPDAWIVIGSPTGIDPPSTSDEYLKSYPNPFNPSVTLVLSFPLEDDRFSGTEVSVAIYAPDGRKVRRLFSGTIRSGMKTLVWDGSNDKGVRVTSGVYFAVAKAGGKTYRTKLVLIK